VDFAGYDHLAENRALIHPYGIICRGTVLMRLDLRAESVMSIHQPTILPAPETSPADKALLDRLRRIPGVRVRTATSNPLGSLIHEVTVESGNADAEMAVYRAEQEVHQQFHDARIELYVV